MEEKPKKVPLTKEQKINRLKQKLKALKDEDKILERKNRARNLVQIGAIVSSVSTHQKFYDYLTHSEANKNTFIEFIKTFPPIAASLKEK